MGEVIIPTIAFIEGGMTIPVGKITRDYLRNHRLCPQQCAPNFFRILGAVDSLDRHLGLGLTWHDVVHLYEGHQQKRVGYYLKSQFDAVRLISCLPKFNKFRFSNIRFKLFVIGLALLCQKDFLSSSFIFLH